MADEHLLSKVHSLSDLELAFLLSLIAREHCQIRTSAAAIPDLVAELRLVSAKIFGLQPVVISCTPQTTLDDFASALLLPPNPSGSTKSSPTTTFRAPYPLATHSPRPRQQQQHNHNHDGGPSSSHFHPSSSAGGHFSTTTTSPSIAPVILAANLDTAPKAVQIQALELLRTRRVFTRTSVHTAPKTFLFVAVVSDDHHHRRAPASGGGTGGEGLNHWLNEWFYLAHAHSAEEDGYLNLEEEEDSGDDEEGTHTGLGLHGGFGDNDDDDHVGVRGATGKSSKSAYYHDNDAASTASIESVVVNKPPHNNLRVPSFSGQLTRRTRANGKLSSSSHEDEDREPVITDSDIAYLSNLSQHVTLDIDVARYSANVVSFLRMHRAVEPGAGVFPQATKHLEQLTRSLAPLHGLDYVTPALVRLAARKVYLHRVRIVAPERERSMQWGSELAAVEAVLDGVGPEDVIEDILGLVTAPL